MLSQKIAKLAAALENRCDNETLTVDVVRLAVNQLHGLAEEAEAMETNARPADPPVESVAAPNVTRIAEVLARWSR